MFSSAPRLGASSVPAALALAMLAPAASAAPVCTAEDGTRTLAKSPTGAAEIAVRVAYAEGFQGAPSSRTITITKETGARGG